MASSLQKIFLFAYFIMGSAGLGSAATLSPGTPLDYRFDFSPPRAAGLHIVFIDFDDATLPSTGELAWSVGLTRGGADFPIGGDLVVTEPIGSSLSTASSVAFDQAVSTAFVRLSIAGGVVGIDRVAIYDGNDPEGAVVATAPIPLPPTAALVAVAFAALGSLRRKQPPT